MTIDGFFTDETESAVVRAGQTVWRINYLFAPLIVTIVSLFVGFFDRSRYKFLLIFITLLPFIAFQSAAHSFSIDGFLFSLGYLGIALVVALLIPNRPSENMTGSSKVFM